MPKIKISAVIITFNEERNIGRCLESLRGVADEIVVVDSFSTDCTREICEKHAVRFLQNPFAGHIEQKNFALAQAHFPHVLSLDADESLSGELKISILKTKENWLADGYSMNRLTNFCGQWIWHSGWYPDRKIRLFDKRLARWGGTNPHDRVEMPPGSSVNFLPGDLLHHSYYTENEHVARAKRYSEIAAGAMRQQGRKAHWWNLVFSPVFKFLRNYVLRLGFLDGRAGFRICWVAAQETFWKYRLLRAAGS